MKPYLVKYLPVNDKVTAGCYVDVYVPVGERPYKHQIIKVESVDLSEGLIHLEDNSSVGIGYCTVVKLFLISFDINVGDKCYPFMRGHIDEVKSGRGEWDARDFMSGWPDDPHTMLDMEYSKYGPYEYRTDYGFGHSGMYGKVIGEISPGLVWIKDRDVIEPQDISSSPDGQPLLYAKKVKLRCPTCKTFH